MLVLRILEEIFGDYLSRILYCAPGIPQKFFTVRAASE